MKQNLKIGIIGDFNPAYPTHIAINEALLHAADALSVTVEPIWIPTEPLEKESSETFDLLNRADALWGSSGSPYRSMAGALQGIRFAREQGRPFIGTCGGFQHTLLEYARNVVGMSDAEHEEYAPGASTLVVSELSCSIAGTPQPVNIVERTLAWQVYQTDKATEDFRCHYGLNPEFHEKIFSGPMKISGTGPDGEVRIIELSGHTFFIATLFVPQVRSGFSNPHPLIIAYLKAAADI